VHDLIDILLRVWLVPGGAENVRQQILMFHGKGAIGKKIRLVKSRKILMDRVKVLKSGHIAFTDKAPRHMFRHIHLLGDFFPSQIEGNFIGFQQGLEIHDIV